MEDGLKLITKEILGFRWKKDGMTGTCLTEQTMHCVLDNEKFQRIKQKILKYNRDAVDATSSELYFFVCKNAYVNK